MTCKATTAAILISSTLMSNVALAKAGPYIGVNVGAGRMDTVSIGHENAKYKLKEELGGLAAGLDIGYLWEQEKLEYGAEFGFDTYAENSYKLDDQNSKYKGYNFDLLSVVKYKFNPQWSLFGKAGIAYVNQKTTGDTKKNLNDNNKEIKPKAAFGVGYNITENLEINAEYSHVFASTPNKLTDRNVTKDNYNEIASVDMLTIGTKYSF